MGPAITVIFNADSGRGRAHTAPAEVEQLFAKAGRPARILTPKATELAPLLVELTREPTGVMVAAGGDGTISTVAASLVGTRWSLGVLPLGTFNHFAKDMHIPLELVLAVETIARGQTQAVDVGEVNGCVFINNSSLGLYPRLVSSREDQQRLGRGKWPAFAWAFLQTFRRYPFLDLRITMEGKTIDRRTAFLFVGNNEYLLSGLNLGGRVSLRAGQLGLCVTRRTGRLGLLRLFLNAVVGRLDQARDFDRFLVESATIESRHARILVATDGEITSMKTPLRFRIRPQALRVLAPTPVYPS